jgi:predicted RNase H-like HicB family nuclease
MKLKVIIHERVARSPAPYYPQTTEDQAHSRLTSAITTPQTPRWRPPAAGDCAAQPLTGTRCAALLGTCARARATRRQAPSAEEGGYWAEVPAIPGCATQGETFEELLQNLYEAVEGCLSVDVRST